MSKEDWNTHTDPPPWEAEPNYITLVFDELLHTTAKAYLISFGDKEIWVPKSISTIRSTNHQNFIDIKEWFVEQNELEIYEEEK
ncbi:MAG: hypothetical protein EHM49_00395 [Deltaproteobacteria bacterium]|nr:MAG: hypothetical protein EHM49_00395 [Deltaproteobacteria bacterium]